MASDRSGHRHPPPSGCGHTLQTERSVISLSPPMAMSLLKRFSLKSLMIAMAALAVLLAVPRQRSLRQQYALRRMGAEVDGGVGLGSQGLASRLFFGDCDGDRAEGLIFRDVALSEPDATRLALFPLLERI